MRQGSLRSVGRSIPGHPRRQLSAHPYTGHETPHLIGVLGFTAHTRIPSLPVAKRLLPSVAIGLPVVVTVAVDLPIAASAPTYAKASETIDHVAE
jgi:hypothetical protein